MAELTAFDVAYRDPLTGDLLDRFKSALEERRVLTVSATRPAVDIAQHVEAIAADIVNVVDDAQNTVGHIFPGWVIRQVRSNVTPVGSFLAAVKVLNREQRIPGRDHLHEWLNFDQPNERTCPGNVQDPPHQTFWDPCLDHGL